MKSSSYACRLIDKQTQLSVGCQQYMHTHLMSPVLAITSGTANDRLGHILELCEHSCNLIFQFPATIDHISNCCHLLYFGGILYTCQSKAVGLYRDNLDLN